MIGIVVGTLIYSIATTPPVGWKQVPRSLCEQAYGPLVMRANCFQKEIVGG